MRLVAVRLVGGATPGGEAGNAVGTGTIAGVESYYYRWNVNMMALKWYYDR